MRGYNEEDGPKRRVFASFGPLVSVMFFLFAFFISINKLTGINDMDVRMGGYDEEIGPKRRETRRLGH